MKRRVREEEEVGELNIVPYLDIVVNLVMFMLLSMTSLISLGVLNISAPKIGGDPASAGLTDPNAKPLLLTVAVSKKGFYIAGAGGVLPGVSGSTVDANQPPTIPLRNLLHDFDALTGKMLEIKKLYPKETNLILSADGDIQYEILVKTMDACREAKVKLPDGTVEPKPLFFDVSLSTIG